MNRALVVIVAAVLLCGGSVALAQEPSVPSAPPPVVSPAPPQVGPASFFGEPRYRSPGLAIALSLQPLPIDLGNLYAENLGWGLFYSAAEVSLLAPMMWIGGEHMDHGYNDQRRWTGMEMGLMAGMVSGYVVVKVVAGVHAGYAARDFDRRYGSTALGFVIPTAGGAMLGWGGTL